MGIARLLVTSELLGEVVANLPGGVAIIGSDRCERAIALMVQGPGVPEGASEVQLIVHIDTGSRRVEVRAMEAWPKVTDRLG